MRHKPMHMSDYATYLDNVLRTTGERLLEGAGAVSHQAALKKTKAEYKKFQVQNLSPVEEAYLQTIRDMEKTARKKSREE